MEDVLVVGGGTAGLNAALILARARRRVLVVDAGDPRNAPAEGVHGFIGHDGTPPATLLTVGRAEIERYGGRIVTARVSALRRETDGWFTAELDGEPVRARRLVLATGLRDELPAVPGLRERWGRDVLHCPYCHGWEVRDRTIGLLGTGPLAAHKALLVRQWSADIVLVTPDELEADDRDRLSARGVRLVRGTPESLVVESDLLRGIRLAHGETVAVSVVFVQPRFVPHDELLVGLGCDRDESGWVTVDSNGLTSIPGVWAVGNVADPLDNVVTSAAAGSKAAYAINMDLVTADTHDALAASTH